MNIAAILISFETAYIVGANWFLRRKPLTEVFHINDNPDKLMMRFESPKSYWPGDIRVKAFEISGHNGSVKWNIKTGPLVAEISLSSLLHRILEIDSIDISTAQVNVELWQPRPPENITQSDKAPFWLKFHKLRIAHLESAQVHNYLYSGDASVTGSFDLWPGRQLDIWSSAINIDSGEIRHDNKVVLKDAQALLETKIHDYHPDDEKNLEILNHLKRVSLWLKGNIDEPSIVNWYLKDVPWLRMAKLKGAVEGNVEVQNGNVISGTNGKVNAEHIDFEVGPYSSLSTGVVEWSFNKKSLKLRNSLNDYLFFGPSSKDSFMRGKSLTLEGTTKTLGLQNMFLHLRDLDIAMKVEKAKITDLGVINDFIPVSDKLKIVQGQADFDSLLYLSTTHPSKKGFLKLKTSNARTQFRDLRFDGNAEINSTFRNSEKGIDVFEMTDTFLKVSDVNMLGKKNHSKKIQNWRGQVDIPLAYIRPKYNVISNGHFKTHLDNAEPILIGLGQEFRLFRILRKVAAVDHVTGEGDFQIGPKLFSFEDVKLDSSDINLKGRYQFYENQHKFLMWFKYDTLKAAIEYNGKNSSYAVNNTLKWYEKHGAWPKIESKKIVKDATTSIPER